MRRLAILTSLALVATSVTAFAQPYGRTERRDRDRRGDRDRGRDDGWEQLGRVQHARTATQTLMLNGNHSRIRKLMLKPVRGAPMIKSVTIDYFNAPAQVVPVHARIGRGGEAMIRLDARGPIQRIMIYPNPRYGGSYIVYGS